LPKFFIKIIDKVFW